RGSFPPLRAERAVPPVPLHEDRAEPAEAGTPDRSRAGGIRAHGRARVREPKLDGRRDRRRRVRVTDHRGLNDGQRALLDLAREVAAREIAPNAARWEHDGVFPREAFTALGKAGLLGLPYPEQYGGGGQPHWVYLLVLEELARALL